MKGFEATTLTRIEETSTLTLPLLKRAIKILKPHRAINQESDLTSKQWEKLRQSFGLCMERNEEFKRFFDIRGRLT